MFNHFIKKFIVLIIAILSLVQLYAQTAGIGIGQYLEETTSSALLSTGKTGYTEDVGQMWLNPATLYPYIKGRTLSLSMFTNTSTLGNSFERNNFAVGYAWPGSGESGIHKYSIGTSILNNSSIQNFDSSGSYLGTFSTLEAVTGFAHFWKLTQKIYLSETAKLYYYNYEEATYMQMAFDFGMMYRPFNFFDMNISLDNFYATNANFAGYAESQPMILRLNPVLHFLGKKGALFYEYAYYLPFYNQQTNLSIQRVGLQFNIFKENLIARFGYDGLNYSMGISTKIAQYKVHVGYLPSAGENTWSFTFSFNMDETGVGPFARPKTVKSSDLEEELVDFFNGMEDYNKGNYKKSHDNFKRVLDLNPDHKMARMYMKRSVLHLRSSNWLDEEQEKLIKMHKELALKYELKSNYGESIAEWRKVAQLNPADPEAPINIKRIKRLVQEKVMTLHRSGLEAYGKNDKLKAIDGFSGALKLNPEYNPSKTWLVKIKQELSKEELHYREKIERQQKAEVFFTRGMSYYSKGYYQQAYKSFAEAYRFHPKHPRAKKMMVESKERLELLRKGGLGREASIKYYQTGIRFYKTEEYFEAIKEFNKALIAFAANNDARKMIPDAERKLKEQVQPIIREGIEKYKKKKFFVARERFKAVRNLDPDNSEVDKYINRIENEMEAGINYNFREGRKAFRKGQFSKAIEFLFEVVNLEKERRSTNEEAEKLLKQSQLRVKNDIGSLLAKGQKHFDDSDFSSALELFEKVLEIDAANALAIKYVKECKKKKKNSQNQMKVTAMISQTEDILQNRDFSNALILINKALKLDRRNKKVLALKKKIENEVALEKVQEKISVLFIEGVRFYKFKKYDNAIAKWTQVRQLDNQNALVARYIKRAREAKKNYKIIDYINCQKYLKRSALTSARASCLQAIKLNPSNSKARKLLEQINEQIAEEREQVITQANGKFKNGEYDEAARLYFSALRLKKDPTIAEKRTNAKEAAEKVRQGNKYFSSADKIGLCFEPYMRVLELNPLDKTVNKKIKEAKARGKKQINNWLALAKQAQANKEYKKAYSYYVSITQIQADNLEAKKNIILTRNKLKSKAEIPYKETVEAMAIKNYNLAIRKAKTVLAILNPYRDTRDLLKKAVRMKSTSNYVPSNNKNLAKHNGTINRGIVFYRQGKYRQAIGVWRRVPKSSSAYSRAAKYINRARLKMR